ncbi:MAG: DUF6941 family protein [Actinomycetota bacterium]
MPEVETLMVANHIEAINGLLYVSGGGWTDLWRGAFPEGQPPVNHLGIGLGVRIGWTETNRRHHLVVKLAHEDGEEVFRGEADVEVGRPPGVPEGSDQRAVLAITLEMQFPRSGGYQLAAEVAREERSISFRVHDRPPPSR